MKPLLLLYGLLFFAGVAHSQPQYFTRDYRLNESNTSVKVNALAQNNQGFMWLGTDEGLYRFNGALFQKIDDTLHQPITALAACGKRIWIGYKNGAIAYLNDQNKVCILSGRLPSVTINSLLPESNGLILAGTAGQGIFAACNGRSSFFNTTNGLSDDFVYDVHFLLPFTNDSTSVIPFGIVAGTDNGVNIIKAENGKLSVRCVKTKQGLLDNITRALSPLNPYNNFCVGLQEHGLNFIVEGNSGEWSAFKNAGDWHYGQVNDLYRTNFKDGIFEGIVATDQGLLLVNSAKGVSVLTDKKINKIIPDHKGNLWCATNDGLLRVAFTDVFYLKQSTSFELKSVTAMACKGNEQIFYSQEKELWMSPLNGTETATKIWTSPETITTICADSNGALWIGTLGHGLYYRSTTGNVKPVKDLADCFKLMQILSMVRTPGKLWISTLNSVYELSVNPDKEPTVFNAKEHSKAKGVGSDYVYQLFPDSKGNMWMATDGAGICMYDGKTYHHWDAVTGFKSKVVYSITEDADGHIWAATLNSGLYEFDGKKWQAYSKEDGLQDINIATLIANKTGQVMMANTQGFDVWYNGSKQFRHYSRRLGVGIDESSNVLNCAAHDAAGNVYMPFNNGFIVYPPQERRADIDPNVTISDIALFLQPLANGKTKFDHEENNLSFHFQGINYANPERLHYRYQLQGYNDLWTPTGDESVTFPQLPPGKYLFRVQASQSASFINASEDRYCFTIAKPFWTRWGFIALFAAGLILIIYALLRLRVRNIKKVSQLQNGRVVAEYEQLKSQVNPHFLFNSLNTLVNLIEDDQERAVDYTVQLSDMYRSMLSFKNNETVLLCEEWAILEKYLFIQQTRFGNALQIKISLDEELMQEQKVVPLALQMLVENAIKHNVVQRLAPLVIHVDVDDDYLVIHHILHPKISEEKGAGIGIANIKNRYALLTKKQVLYGVQGNEYIVKLPLL